MARLLMGLLALMNLLFLWWVLFNPIDVVEFVGLAAVSPTAQVEIRSMYGGLIGGLGVINLLGALSPKRLGAALWATAWAFAGVGVVRAISCAVYGIGGWQLVFATSEIAACVTCFWLLSRQPHTER